MKNGTLPARKLDKEKSSHHGLSDTQNPQNCFLLAFITLDRLVRHSQTHALIPPPPPPLHAHPAFHAHCEASSLCAARRLSGAR